MYCLSKDIFLPYETTLHFDTFNVRSDSSVLQLSYSNGRAPIIAGVSWLKVIIDRMVRGIAGRSQRSVRGAGHTTAGSSR